MLSYAVPFRKSIKTRKDGTPEEIADDMAALVHELCSESGIDEGDIETVGIGIPGPFCQILYMLRKQLFCQSILLF